MFLLLFHLVLTEFCDPGNGSQASTVYLLLPFPSSQTFDMTHAVLSYGCCSLGLMWIALHVYKDTRPLPGMLRHFLMPPR